MSKNRPQNPGSSSPYGTGVSSGTSPYSTAPAAAQAGGGQSPVSASSHPKPTSGTTTVGQYSDPVLTTGATGVSSQPSAVDSVKDRANESAQVSKQAAGEVAHTATDKAKDVAAETKQQAFNVLGQAQDQFRQQTQTQQHNLVNNLRAFGDQLSSMANNADSSGPAVGLVGQAGERVHGAASWLESRQPSDLVGEARSYASRKPAVFILGALVAGVAAGRLTRGVVASHKDQSGSLSAGNRGVVQPGAQPYAVTGTQPAASTYVEPGYAGQSYADPGVAAGTPEYVSGTTAGYTTGYSTGPAAGGIEP